jgi:TonB-dependent SusC/RagA subfamily outer membrane receptor
MEMAMRRILAPVARTLCAALVIACAPGAPVGEQGPEPRPATRPMDNTGKSLVELFQGRFPGVEAYAVQGGVKIRIRNSSSLDGSGGDPLFLIDDLPVSPPDGVLTMNPNDIVKIEILKDDSATLIYGNKAANGVVKITTKRK